MTIVLPTVALYYSNPLAPFGKEGPYYYAILIAREVHLPATSRNCDNQLLKRGGKGVTEMHILQGYLVLSVKAVQDKNIRTCTGFLHFMLYI